MRLPARHVRCGAPARGQTRTRAPDQPALPSQTRAGGHETNKYTMAGPNRRYPLLPSRAILSNYRGAFCSSPEQLIPTRVAFLPERPHSLPQPPGTRSPGEPQAVKQAAGALSLRSARGMPYLGRAPPGCAGSTSRSPHRPFFRTATAVVVVLRNSPALAASSRLRRPLAMMLAVGWFIGSAREPTPPGPPLGLALVRELGDCLSLIAPSGRLSAPSVTINANVDQLLAQQRLDLTPRYPPTRGIGALRPTWDVTMG